MKQVYHSFPSESALVQACLQSDRQAQHALYARYAGPMLRVCKRYLNDAFEAEDALMEAFVKVFGKLAEFQGKGSLEGWIRRIVVNEALMKLRQQKSWTMEAYPEQEKIGLPPEGLEPLAAEEILNLIARLPLGYQTVFKLYALEGYAHAEIAEMLGISEGTSKSQLARARQLLQEKFKALQHE